MIKKLFTVSLLALVLGACVTDEERARKEQREKARQDSIAALLRAIDEGSVQDTSTNPPAGAETPAQAHEHAHGQTE